MKKIKGALSLSGMSFLALAINFFATPLYLKWMGKEAFGVYLFAFLLVGYLNMLDFGFRLGAQQEMIKEHDNGNHHAFWQKWKTNLILTLLVAITGLALFLIAGKFFPKIISDAKYASQILYICGVYFFFSQIQSSIAIIFVARSQFTLQGAINGIGTLTGTCLGIYWAYLYKSPAYIMLGQATIFALQLLISTLIISRELVQFFFSTAFDKTSSKRFMQFGLKQYSAAVAGNIASKTDKALIGAVASKSMLSDFALAAKFPEILFQIFFHFTQPMLPELTNKFNESAEAWSESFKKNSLYSLVIGCAFVMIICACSKPLFELWLGDFTPKNAVLICFLMGIYWGLEVYFNCLVLATYAANCPQICFPFSCFNGIATVALTLPMFYFMGITGVALLNAVINLVQLSIMIVVFKHKLQLQIDLKEYYKKTSQIFTLAAVFCIVGYFMTSYLMNFIYPIAIVMLLPVFSLMYIYTVFSLKIIQTPQFIVEKINQAKLSKCATTE